MKSTVAASVALTLSCQLALPPLPVAERHTQGVGAAIYLELCNRVAARHFVDDLAGEKTRHICRGHEAPGAGLPAPLYALASRRDALIDALDRALDPPDDKEARDGGPTYLSADDHPTQKFLNGLMPLHDSARTRRFGHAAARWLAELNSPAMRALIADSTEEAWGVFRHLGSDVWAALLERLWDVLAAPEKERAGVAKALGDLMGHLHDGTLARDIGMLGRAASPDEEPSVARELRRAADMFDALSAGRPAGELERARLAVGGLVGHLDRGPLGEVLREMRIDSPEWAARLARLGEAVSPTTAAEVLRVWLLWMRQADALAYAKASEHDEAPGHAFRVNAEVQDVLDLSRPARYDADAPPAERSLWTRLLGIMHDTRGVPMGNKRLNKLCVYGDDLNVDIAADSLFFIPDMTRMFLEALAGQGTLDLCVKRDFQLVPDEHFWAVEHDCGEDEVPSLDAIIYDLYALGLTNPTVPDTGYVTYLGLTRGRMRPIAVSPEEGGRLCAARLGGAPAGHAMARFQVDIEAMLRMLMVPVEEQAGAINMGALFEKPRLGGEPFCARRADAVIALEVGDVLPALQEILAAFLGPDPAAPDDDRGLAWLSRALAATYTLWHGDAGLPPAADVEPLLAHWLPALATGVARAPATADLEALGAQVGGGLSPQPLDPAALVEVVARAGRALAQAPAGALEADVPQSLRALADGDPRVLFDGALGPVVHAALAPLLRMDIRVTQRWVAGAFSKDVADAWSRLLDWPAGRALAGEVLSRLAEVPLPIWLETLEVGKVEVWPELAPRLSAWLGDEDNVGHHVWALLTDLRALDTDGFLPKLVRRLMVAVEEGAAPPWTALSEAFVQVNRVDPHARGALDVADVERLLAKVAAFLRDKDNGLDRLLDIIEHRNL